MITHINIYIAFSRYCCIDTFGILSVTPSISGTRLSSISSITTSSSSSRCTLCVLLVFHCNLFYCTDSSSVMSTIPTNLPTGTSSSKLGIHYNYHLCCSPTVLFSEKQMCFRKCFVWPDHFSKLNKAPDCFL